MYSSCACDQCGPPPGLGAWGGNDFDPSAPGAPQGEAQWYNRAIDWARALFTSRLPDCRDPFTDPEVAVPCPGEIPPHLVRALWMRAPLPARAELWARTVGNNPQWRCANPGGILSDPRTGVVVQRAAMGGRDCRMSNDRAQLAPAWATFVDQWSDPTDAPGWIEDNILEPIGAGAAQGILPALAAGLAIFAVTRS